MLLPLGLLGLLVSTPAATHRAAASPTVDGISLDAAPHEVLVEILASAGLPKATVSSYERTTHKQAALMYGICERDGLKKAKRLYSSKSHSILDVYAANSTEPEDKVVRLMTQEVEAVLERLGPGRKTMMHVASKNFTFDVAPSSLASRSKFKAALARHPSVSRYFAPGGAERAFHIEVSRELVPLAGTWTGACQRDGAEGSPVSLEIGLEGHPWSGELELPGGRILTFDELTLDRTGRTIAAEGDITFKGRFDASWTELKFPSSQGAICTARRRVDEAAAG